MENNFKIGDEVEIVKYGHLIWENKNSDDFKKETIFPIIWEDDSIRYIDIDNSLVGQIGIINNISQNSTRMYSLSGIKGKSCWYNEKQLKKVMKKLSRKEIFEDIKQTVFVLIKMKKDAIYQENKNKVKTLQDMANLNKARDEMDIQAEMFILLEEAGVQSYEQLDSLYNQIQDGLDLPDGQHNAIISTFAFVDFEYQNQNNIKEEKDEPGV